jgi:hypothetical protein
VDTGGVPFSGFFYNVKFDKVRPWQQLRDDSGPMDVATAWMSQICLFCDDSDKEVNLNF